MRSFISSSNGSGGPGGASGCGGAGMRSAWLLIGSCVLVALAAEGSARLALNRVSRIERRTAEEYRLARTVGADACGRNHVLFVGNSLLEEDVQFDRVRDALAAQWDARRFVVEQ